jgi:hypothetical protein
LPDQLSETGVEPESGWRIDLPVEFVELEFPGLIVVDPPPVLV